MKRGLIIMTALVPTRGHEYLVRFARQFLANTTEYEREHFTLDIMICSRDREPTFGKDRVWAFQEMFPDDWSITTFMNFHGEVPQNPEDHPDFWNHWANTIKEFTKSNRRHDDEFDGTYDYLFVSEKWGTTMAEHMPGTTFIPCDIARSVVPISGTKVRKNPIEHWDYILPYFQKTLGQKVTVFGAESTGKTTLSKRLTAPQFELNASFVPEWAREYLETVGPEVTDEKMEVITNAQLASQLAARAVRRKPITIQDTDLLSTIGYYRIYSHREPYRVRELFNESKADLYIVMNSRIPFEPDQLRYGIDKRESTDKFWIELLEEFGCKYHIMQSTEPGMQVVEAQEIIQKNFLDRPVFTYQRD